MHPAIIFVERAQRRIPVNYAKRVQGRKMMGGQSTYIPLKVNAAGVIPDHLRKLPDLLPGSACCSVQRGLVDGIRRCHLHGLGELDSHHRAHRVLRVLLHLHGVQSGGDGGQHPQAGGFIPGVRPGSATVTYIKNVLHRVTLPGGIFIALIAVVPTIIFYFTNNQLIQAFGGTSILIMIGVALDTMSKVESQLKMYNYEGFFK